MTLSLEHFTETGRAVLVEIDTDLDVILARIDRTGLGSMPVVARVKSVPRETPDDPQPGDNNTNDDYRTPTQEGDTP